jgi:tRNA acetyltransferase TAN1
VSGSCAANVQEIQSLCHRVFKSFFEVQDSSKKLRVSLLSDLSSQSCVERSHKFKIDARIRNHTIFSRPTLIQTIATCVPEGHTVDLVDPEVFVLVEVFKVTLHIIFIEVPFLTHEQNVCGVSVVKDYYRLQKFNVMELANEKKSEGNFREGEGRVHDKED